MALPVLLLAAQAAGLGLDMYARRRQEALANYGADEDSRQLSLQMEQENLASSEQALENTRQLREVMATQRAIFAARGQQFQTTPSLLSEKSARTYAADERARQLSMSFKKYQTESRQRLIGIGKKARKEERKNKDFMGALNLLNVNGLSDSLGFGGGQKLGQ